MDRKTAYTHLHGVIGTTGSWWDHQEQLLCMVAECTWKLPGQIVAIDQTGVRDVGTFGSQDLHHKVPSQGHIHPTDLPLVGRVRWLPLLRGQETDNSHYGENGTTTDVVRWRHHQIWVSPCNEQTGRAKKPVKLRLLCGWPYTNSCYNGIINI